MNCLLCVNSIDVLQGRMLCWGVQRRGILFYILSKPDFCFVFSNDVIWHFGIIKENLRSKNFLKRYCLTFVVTETRYPTHKVIRGKFYLACSSQRFQFMHGWGALRESGKAEGLQMRRSSWQTEGRKQQVTSDQQ